MKLAQVQLSCLSLVILSYAQTGVSILVDTFRFGITFIPFLVAVLLRLRGSKNTKYSSFASLVLCRIFGIFGVVSNIILVRIICFGITSENDRTDCAL